MTAEREMPTDLDWHFGFAIPVNVTGILEPDVPGPDRLSTESNEPADMELAQERDLMKKCIQSLKSDVRALKIIRDAIEAWNLADTEAWKFVRAHNARAREVRQAWEDEERRFAGGAGGTGEKRKGWGGWLTGGDDEDEE